MSSQREHQVRAKAFELWEKDGRPDGRDADFWHAAETQMSGGGTGQQSVVATGSTRDAAAVSFANRNALINGNFALNQRNYPSGIGLAAAAYGHDRWKGGWAGCTYSFIEHIPDTTVEISEGTLVQTVEAVNVCAASYWLSWVGTAQARVWQGSAEGAYSIGSVVEVGGVQINTLLVSGLTIGVETSVEFDTGTLGLVQLEATVPGGRPTIFERRLIAIELILCQRYYQVLPAVLASGYSGAEGQTIYCDLGFNTQMRAAPTTTFNEVSYGRAYHFAINLALVNHVRIQMTSTGVGEVYGFADVIMDAEL